MRCYVVFFDPKAADYFMKRAHALCERVGLPIDLVDEKVESVNGQRVGMFISEETAKGFPQFISEFSGGAWLDCS